jgi:flavorubredoxin
LNDILIVGGDNKSNNVTDLIKNSRYKFLDSDDFDSFIEKEIKNPEMLLFLVKDGQDSVISLFLFFIKNKLIDFPIYFIVEHDYDYNWLKSIGIPEYLILNVYTTQLIATNNSILSIDQIIHLKLNSFKDVKDNLKNLDCFSGNFINYSIWELLLFIEKNKKNGAITIHSNSNIYFECHLKNGLISNISSNLDMDVDSSIRQILNLKTLKGLEYDFMSDMLSSESNCEFEVSKLIFDILSGKKFNIKETTRILHAKKTNILDKGVIKSMSENYDKAIEIADGTYWVSERDPKSLLQLNSYLKVYKKDNQAINLLIDPGALEFYTTISRKVSDVIKDVSRLHMYSVNHQDPDVGMNATFISKINPKAACLCTEDTWRLIQFYEIPKPSFKNVYQFENKKINLPTDSSHVIEFVPTPYCHFVGAFALYDRSTRILFTGDLFAGLNPPNNLGLFAEEEHWEGVKTFHQIYMPSKKAIQNAIDNIRNLDLPPLMIVPQHGSILKGEVMDQFLNRLYHLDVGIDLFNKKEDSMLTPVYLEIMNSLYHKFVDGAGYELANKLFDFNNKSQELFYLVDMDSNGIKNIFSQHERALVLLLNKFSQNENYGFFNELKAMAIKECLLRHLPIPLTTISSGSDQNDMDIFSKSSDNMELNFLN